MKAKYIFEIEGDKQAIEVFYNKICDCLPDMKNWEISHKGELTIQRAEVKTSKLEFINITEKEAEKEITSE